MGNTDVCTGYIGIELIELGGCNDVYMLLKHSLDRSDKQSVLKHCELERVDHRSLKSIRRREYLQRWIEVSNILYPLIQRVGSGRPPD